MSQPGREPRRRPTADPRANQPDIYLPPSPTNRELTTDGRMPTATAENFWMPCGVCCKPIQPGETAMDCTLDSKPSCTCAASCDIGILATRDAMRQPAGRLSMVLRTVLITSA